MSRVVLLTGSNAPQSESVLHRTAQILARRIGSLECASQIYYSEPWGFHAERMFANQALLFTTTLSPVEVLDEALGAEQEVGRDRAQEQVDKSLTGERYASREERYALWRRVEKKYMPWRDYDGCEFMEKGGFWLATHHIFKYPFYYIEYALAQLASFEIYLQAEEDRNVGWGNYMKLCDIGGKVPYKESLKLCGLHDPFSEGTVKDIAEKIEAKILRMIK